MDPFGNEKPAELTAAARILAIEFGVSVLIECGYNTLPESSLTGREVIHEMKPMTVNMMRRLPQFFDLLVELRKQGIEDRVLAACSGAPALLDELNKRLARFNSTTSEEKNESGDYVFEG